MRNGGSNGERPEDGISAQAQTSPTLNLAETRSSRGLTLQHIAEATCISMRFLEAIEAEEFSKLPEGVYAINYVRQYARLVGCDESLLLERCSRVSSPETVSTKSAEALLTQARPRLGLFPAVQIQRILSRFGVAIRARKSVRASP